MFFCTWLVRVTEWRLDKWDCIRLQSLCHSKENRQKSKETTTQWRKPPRLHLGKKENVFNVYMAPNLIVNIQSYQLKHDHIIWIDTSFFFTLCFFFSFFFITYFPQLHFQCYPKSPPYPPPPIPYPPIPIFWPWHSPVLGHIKFACPMGLSFQWWLTRPSFDTYAARDTSSGVLVSS